MTLWPKEQNTMSKLTFHTGRACCMRCGGEPHDSHCGGKPHGSHSPRQHVNAELAEQLEAMAPPSSFRLNQRTATPGVRPTRPTGNGNPASGIIHGRYQPGPAPSLRNHTRAEDIPPEQLAAAPPSSFRPNPRTAKGGRS
jgi:hypothetical protein